jgi:hypothetical protein
VAVARGGKPNVANGEAGHRCSFRGVRTREGRLIVRSPQAILVLVIGKGIRRAAGRREVRPAALEAQGA